MESWRQSLLQVAVGDNTPDVVEVEPIMAKIEIMLNRANATSCYFGIKPYAESIDAPGPTREFDYGLNPRAILFDLYPAPAGEFKGCEAYEIRKLLWYATQGQGVENVWSTNRIVKHNKVISIKPNFQEVIKNFRLTLTRSNEEKCHITLADLPWLNMGDIVTLLKMWKNNQHMEEFAWLTRYLKSYLECLFTDFSYQDVELAKITKFPVKKPNNSYSDDKKKRSIGEIFVDETGLAIYFEIERKDKSTSKRMMRLSELSLFPTDVIMGVMSVLKDFKSKTKFKKEVMSRVNWFLEWRKRMLDLPGQFFPHKLTVDRPLNQRPMTEEEIREMEQLLSLLKIKRKEEMKKLRRSLSSVLISF